MNNITNNDKGVVHIFVILLIVLVLGIAAYWYLAIYAPGLEAISSPTTTETKLIKKTENTQENNENNQFEEIPETENTPSEINNENLNDLDQIILSVEGEEDLSDL